MHLRTVLSLAFSAAALAVAGCNHVVSTEPWFQQEAGSPKLRDGVWLGADADCAFDETRPVERWPSCASPGFVKNGALLQQSMGSAWKSADGTVDIVIAPGAPLIAQIEKPDKMDDGSSERLFLYYGMEAKAQDPAGRITGAILWPVICGPVEGGERVTRRPWPGLTVAQSDCTAASAEAVREAAGHSRKLAAEKGGLATFRWVRDGSR